MAYKKITDLPDIPIADGDDYLEIVDVSAGTSNKVKVSDLNRKISCHMTLSSAQTIPHSTWTVLNWTSEDWDLDNMHDNSVNNQRITIKTAGIYRISANVNFDDNQAAGALRSFSITKNGTSTIIVRDNRLAINSAGFLTTGKLSTLHNCAVNDYFIVNVWQNSGGGLNVMTTYLTEFMAELVS